MAQILLVDSNEVARKAMKGILARGGHRFATVDTAAAAAALIRRNVRVDLVFTELRLPGDGGLALIRQLRADRLLRYVPIVVYTEHADRETVKRALELRVQNFLIKPFVDDDIFAEIDKAEANPWRARHFEEEKSFCRLTGQSPEHLHAQLDGVRGALLGARAGVEHAAKLRDHALVNQAVFPVREMAEGAGAWGAVEAVTQLTDHTSAGAWAQVPGDLAQIEFAADLVAHWLDPERVCPDFIGQLAADSAELARERALWLSAPAQGRCPLATPEQLRREIELLNGCPVIDSAAAGFQMIANGHPSCINPLMDLVARDPGLTVQMLVAANRAHPPADEFNRIEDARLAVGQLGEIRLQEESRRLVQLDGKTFALEPAFSWAQFWVFQRAVARIAQLICRDLEFESLEPVARTAGQIHDLGLLLLAHLRPAGFQAILEHSRVHRVPLRECERLFLGCTTPELATHFGERQQLSTRLLNVLRHIEHPGRATDDKHLVAIISLARDLCLHNEIGVSGEPHQDTPVPLEETAEWAILREGLYPSFNLHKFELRVHAYCSQLRTELSGHKTGTVGEIVAAARG